MHAVYQDGATLEEVGKRYGITRERVRQLFKKAGLKTRSRQETLELKRRRDPTVAEMYALYEQGATLKEVGPQFGRSAERVGELFEKAGLKRRSRERPVQEMHTLYKDGATLDEVGERFGISGSQVCHLFKKAGLKTRGRGERGGG